MLEWTGMEWTTGMACKKVQILFLFFSLCNVLSQIECPCKEHSQPHRGPLILGAVGLAVKLAS